MVSHRRPPFGSASAHTRTDSGSDADDDEEKHIYFSPTHNSHSPRSTLSSVHYDIPSSPSPESGLMGPSFSTQARAHHARSKVRSFSWFARRKRTTSSASPSSAPSSNIRFRPAIVRAMVHWPNRRFTRLIGFGILGLIALFILFLVRQSFVSARQAEIGWPEKARRPKVWQSFTPLEGYYRGLQAVVPKDENKPENGGKVVYVEEVGPGGASRAFKHVAPLMDLPSSKSVVPSPEPFVPFPDYDSSEYISRFGASQECFLDAQGSIPVPNILAYPGVPAGMPNPLAGSYSLFGIRDDVCFDRVGRLGPYGLQEILPSPHRSKIDWSKVRWADAQSRCIESNRARFESSHNATVPVSRSVILLRTWLGYEYTPEDILHLRALISELGLKSRGEYTVHFLIHVKDDNLPIWADEDTYQSVLASALPPEFAGMGSLWSERQMGLIYGGLTESMFRGLPVHGVYRSIFMPVQYFSEQHPEFDYVWQWEMDARYTGHYYHLFDRITSWAVAQPRRELWERNSRFYIPAIHGSWADFRHTVRVQIENAVPDPAVRLKGGFDKTHASSDNPRPSKPVWGPLQPSEPDRFETESDPVPPVEKSRDDDYSWGVGEQADLITFNPIFDPDRTAWILAEDVSGYRDLPPRRASVTTASRLSRRLLKAMHRETALARHTMFSEMWPSSCALHHGLKAVYAPHPLFFDRSWPADYAAQTLNAGPGGSSGGSRASVFSDELQHNLQGSTWYYESQFGPRIWRRWLGLSAFGIGAGADSDVVKQFIDANLDLPQLDEGERTVPDHLRDLMEQARGGGEVWERSAGGRVGNGDAGKPENGDGVKPQSVVATGGTGRMCLPAMLLHPIKRVTGVVLDPVDVSQPETDTTPPMDEAEALA